MHNDNHHDLDPLVAYPPCTRLADLRTAESFLIVTVRLWVARRLEPQAGHSDWRDGFRAANVCDVGSACFQSFLNILEAAARHPIRLGCPHWLELTENEARLLCIVGLLQRERSNDAALLLADWLPPAAIRVATDYAVGFAMALADARLTLPQRNHIATESRQAVQRHPVTFDNRSTIH